jgi:adenine deaminase
MRKFFAALIILISMKSFAQETFPFNGVRPKDVTSVAFTHATIIVDPSTTLSDATLVIEKGIIIAAGKDVVIPENAVVYDLQGKFIYPSFIDVYSNYGMP